MVTWNIDLDNYSIEELEELLTIVEKLDNSISKEISDFIESKKYFGNDR